MTHTPAAQHPRRTRSLAAVGAALVVLGAAGCAGQGAGGPGGQSAGSSAASSSSTAGSSTASPTSGGSASASTTASGSPTSGSASFSPSSTGESTSSAGSTLSLEMPATLDPERVRAVNAVIDAAAPDAAETGTAHHSPLERATDLRSGAESLTDTVHAANPSASIGPAEQTCVDATRKGLEADAERGAADVTFTVQPVTAATTGGASGASSTSARGGEVTPLGVQVVAYPDAAAARAAMDQSQATAKTCTGADLGAWGLKEVREVPAGDHDAAFEGVSAGGSVYAHGLVVLDGLYVVSVQQADAEGGVPADALDRSSTIADDVLKALTAEG